MVAWSLNGNATAYCTALKKRLALEYESSFNLFNQSRDTPRFFLTPIGHTRVEKKQDLAFSIGVVKKRDLAFSLPLYLI